MHWISSGVALLLALAIITIGVRYVASPTTATRSFGLPLPEEGTNIAWWLRLKGSRDIVSGLAVMALLVWGGSRAVGILLLVEAIVPVADMLLILAAKGSAKIAFGVHGSTALLMIPTAISLVVGVP